MSVEELEAGVESLPREQYRAFRHWFIERDWAIWDQEIEDDAKAGRLDFLLREASEAKRRGTLRNL